ncbi:hypothetical protein LINGRAHAP2_LOCUS13337 [Linum grandiflorum]
MAPDNQPNISGCTHL